MFRMHTPASRARDRGVAMHSAAGARPAPARTAAGGIFRRLRKAGRGTPVATRTQAVARMPLVARKGGEYMECPRLARSRRSGPSAPAQEGQIKPGTAWLESRALRSDASDATRRRRTL